MTTISKNDELEDYITIVDAQVITGKSKSSLTYLMRKGRIKSYKLNDKRSGIYFTTLKDIDNYMQNKVMMRRNRCVSDCNHEKKTCSKCKKEICVNDFFVAHRIITLEKSIIKKRPSCKDCDYLYKRNRGSL